MILPQDVEERLRAALPPGVLAGLLAAVARLCPQCGAMMTVRSSKGRIKYVRCRPCGVRRKVVCTQNADCLKPEHKEGCQHERA